MKQRITIEQLNKLTDAQKEILRDWWRPATYDVAIGGDGFEEYCLDVQDDGAIRLVSDSEGIIPDETKQDYLPLISIGQMIEFIQEQKPTLKGISKNRFDKWFVNIETAQLGYKDELCDALWEAVTQIIKNMK